MKANRTKRRNGKKTKPFQYDGTNITGKKLSKADIRAKQNAFNAKLSEYIQMPLEELKKLREEGKVKGVYFNALKLCIEELKKKEASEVEEKPEEVEA
jgi:DNA-binding Xre family transcriptional regulator